MTENSRSKTTVKWLAVIDNLGGYALDVYPDELGRYRSQLGAQLIGEFATAKAAMERVRQWLAKTSPDEVIEKVGSESTDDRYRAGQLAMMHRAALAVIQSNLSFDRELLGAISEKILDLTVVDDPLGSNAHAE